MKVCKQEKSTHELECDFNSNNFEIGLNINFTLKALQIMEGETEKVEFYFKSQDKPLIIKKPDNNNYKVVMMPMRISW